MKTFILSADVGAVKVYAGEFVMQDGSGAVLTNTAVGTAIGVANATKLPGEKIGVIKQGLCHIPTIANFGTYNFGDVLELTDAQDFNTGTTNVIGVAAETKTISALDPYLWIYINIPTDTA